MKRLCLFLAILLLATPGQAQIARRATGYAPPVAFYTPSGVHFDWSKTAYYTTSALTTAGGAVADTAHLTVSYWISALPFGAGMNVIANVNTGVQAGIASNLQGITQNAEEVPGQLSLWENTNLIRINMADPLGTTNGNGHQCDYAATVPQTPAPMHVLYSFDGTPAGTAKNLTLYVNGVKVGAGGCTASAVSGVFSAGVSNANGWNLGNFSNAQTGQATFEISDVQVDYTISIVDASNNISAANLARYITAAGKPVDPGASCEKALGHAAHICLTGGPAGFATNKGTVTNTFTQTGLMAATLTPGYTPPNTVQHLGTYGEDCGGGVATCTTVSLGVPTLIGDTILQFLDISDSSGANNHGPPACPTGYTSLASTAPTTNTAQTTLLCKRVVLSNGETDAVTWTWTTNSSRTVFWTTTILRQTNGVDVAAALVNNPVTDTVNFVSPTLTTTADNDALLTYFTHFTNNQSMTVPTGTTRVFSSSFSGSKVAVNFEQLGVAGSVAARTATTSPADDGAAYAVAIKHN